MRCTVIIVLLTLFTLNKLCESNSSCKAWLVQSIPTDMPHLSHVPGVLSTGTFFIVGNYLLVVIVLVNFV